MPSEQIKLQFWITLSKVSELCLEYFSLNVLCLEFCWASMLKICYMNLNVKKKEFWSHINAYSILI